MYALVKEHNVFYLYDPHPTSMKDSPTWYPMKETMTVLPLFGKQTQRTWQIEEAAYTLRRKAPFDRESYGGF